MDEENNNKPSAGVSRSFIFSIFFVLAVIGIVALFIFNRDTTPTLELDKFAQYLADGSISRIQLVSAETQVVAQGRYIKTDAIGNKSYSSFQINIDRDVYDLEYAWGVLDVNGDNVIDDNDVCSLNYIYVKAVNTYSNTKDAKGNDYRFYNSVNPYEVSWWDQWGPTIITVGLSAILIFFLFARMSAAVNSSNKQAQDFNRSRARKVTNSKVRFDDVAGADEEKVEMQELVYYLKDPRKFTKFGAKLPKGVLLVGPPGCGKTLLAKAVAGEAGVPFFTISGSDFVELYVGVGAGRVRDLFRTAKENAPCLVFIDEIDAVGRQRGAGLGGGNDEREQTLNQLLVEMDGFNDNSGIIVIAATNRDDVLDPALLRAGRFDRKITVSLPDRKGREAIFKVHSRNKFVDDEVNFENLARRTVGFSGADIENIMNEAAILAVRANREKITIKDIDEAIDRRVAGPAKNSHAISEHEKQMIAYHESGHAIIGLKYPNSNIVRKITIIPRGNTGGFVLSTPEDDSFTNSKKELIARIVGLMGGRAAEEIFCDDISNGASSDIEKATAIARAMVCEWGMSDLGPIQYERDTGSVFLGRDYTNTQKNFSVETATKIDSEIRKIIDFAHDEAIRVIKENREDVELLAKTLIEREQITDEEIRYLMEHRALKEEKKPEEPAPQETPSEEVKAEENQPVQEENK